MRPPMIEGTATCISALTFSARGTRKLRFYCALAFAVVVRLTAPTPRAQAQTFTVLHSFTGGADGAYPGFDGVIQKSGTLYGSTTAGGDPTCNCGTVFKMNAITGKETVLFSFTDASTAAFPTGNLLFEGASLYSNSGGGPSVDGFGTVFQFNKKQGRCALHLYGRNRRGKSLRRFGS